MLSTVYTHTQMANKCSYNDLIKLTFYVNSMSILKMSHFVFTMVLWKKPRSQCPSQNF